MILFDLFTLSRDWTSIPSQCPLSWTQWQRHHSTPQNTIAQCVGLRLIITVSSVDRGFARWNAKRRTRTPDASNSLRDPPSFTWQLSPSYTQRRRKADISFLLSFSFLFSFFLFFFSLILLISCPLGAAPVCDAWPVQQTLPWFDFPWPTDQSERSNEKTKEKRKKKKVWIEEQLTWYTLAFSFMITAFSDCFPSTRSFLLCCWRCCSCSLFHQRDSVKIHEENNQIKQNSYAALKEPPPPIRSDSPNSASGLRDLRREAPTAFFFSIMASLKNTRKERKRK